MTAKGQQELEVWEELDRNLIALLTSGWGQERICFHADGDEMGGGGCREKYLREQDVGMGNWVFVPNL